MATVPTPIEIVIQARDEFSKVLGTLGITDKTSGPLRSWPDVGALGVTLGFVAFVLWLVF